MKRKAHGAQELRHIQKYVKVTSTAQRSDSPAQAINQRFLNDMVKKSLFIWLAIIPLAILNGALREKVINPLIGEKYGLPLSSISLCCIIFVLCWFCIPLIGKGTAKTYWLIGLWWVILTVLFETGLGLLIGSTFAELVTAYDITTGNLWLSCVLFTGIAPRLIAKIKRII